MNMAESVCVCVTQAIVESVEIAELPESLVMEMAATQYRATLIDMIEKVRVKWQSAHRLCPQR